MTNNISATAASAATEIVKTTDLPGTAQAAHDLSMWGLLMHADIVVQAVLVMLVVASIWSWAIIFDKIMFFKRLEQATAKFERVFWSGQLLDHLYERMRGNPGHPMAQLFVAAMGEWHKGDFRNSDQHQLRAGLKERVFHAMEVAKNRSIESMEKNVNFLALLGSNGLFIGLFGTVWGIMNSFQSIATSKNTSLAVVAPGIAEALFATAIALVATVPAVIFYNIISNKINQFVTKLEDFSYELGNMLSRELDSGTRA